MKAHKGFGTDACGHIEERERTESDGEVGWPKGGQKSGPEPFRRSPSRCFHEGHSEIQLLTIDKGYVPRLPQGSPMTVLPRSIRMRRSDPVFVNDDLWFSLPSLNAWHVAACKLRFESLKKLPLHPDVSVLECRRL